MKLEYERHFRLLPRIKFTFKLVLVSCGCSLIYGWRRNIFSSLWKRELSFHFACVNLIHPVKASLALALSPARLVKKVTGKVSINLEQIYLIIPSHSPANSTHKLPDDVNRALKRDTNEQHEIAGKTKGSKKFATRKNVLSSRKLFKNSFFIR